MAGGGAGDGARGVPRGGVASLAGEPAAELGQPRLPLPGEVPAGAAADAEAEGCAKGSRKRGMRGRCSGDRLKATGRRADTVKEGGETPRAALPGSWKGGNAGVATGRDGA